jgi:hypothetical protein
MSDYIKYRGKCKELAEQAVIDDPALRLVRGWYVDPLWGKEQHWWTVRPDGTIYDPTKLQFPSKGTGEYIEFEGVEMILEGKTIVYKEYKNVEPTKEEGENYARNGWKYH